MPLAGRANIFLLHVLPVALAVFGIKHARAVIAATTYEAAVSFPTMIQKPVPRGGVEIASWAFMMAERVSDVLL